MAPTLDFATALAGQYVIDREIGRGGMGIVYLARDLKLDRWVAIKTLPPHLTDDRETRERFLREARTAAALSHPGIVPVHQADEVGGHVFFVMAYVEGESLAARIRTSAHGRLEPTAVARYLHDVAAVLAFAHGRGVIHRDVKAENILIDKATGRAVVTDFGIARLAESAPLTATGHLVGTVYYLSPEQITGRPVDGRSDLYALGVAGYYATTGRFPFDSPLSSAVLVAHVNDVVAPIATLVPGVPTQLATVIERCLAKDPARRYQSGEEMLAALDGAASADPAAPLVSDTEVHTILRRAAELDGLTGSQPRPPMVVAPSSVKPGERPYKAKHRLDRVREAAAEAGIAPEHVEDAVAELRLARDDAPPIDAPPVSTQGAPTSWGAFGGPREVDFKMVIDGEAPEHDFDLLMEIIRDRLGSRGTLSVVGGTIEWRQEPGLMSGLQSSRVARIVIRSRNGKTSIRVRDTLQPEKEKGLLALVIAVPSVAAASILALAAIFQVHADNLVGPRYASAAAVAGAIAFGAGGYAIAKRIYRNITGDRTKELVAVAEELAEQARASIAAANRGGLVALEPRPRINPRLSTSSG